MGLTTYLWVALGGALGSVARFWFGALVAMIYPSQFPLGTVLINIIGSFVIGLFGTLTGPDGRIPTSFDMRAFVMVGICGGFTTFSAFSLQTLNLVQDGEWLQAGSNVVGSVILCLLAVAAGHWLAGVVNTR